MPLYEEAPSRRKIAGQFVYFSTWLAITMVGAFLQPNPSGHGTHQQLGLPPCPSALIFSRPCPGCGLTTSWTAFIHGDFAASFRAHPIGPILYLFFTITALLALRGWIIRHRFVVDTPNFNRWLLVGAVGFFGFGVARMAFVDDYRQMHDLAAIGAVPPDTSRTP